MRAVGDGGGGSGYVNATRLLTAYCLLPTAALPPLQIGDWLIALTSPRDETAAENPFSHSFA